MITYSSNRLTRVTSVIMVLLAITFGSLLPRLAGVATYLGFLLGCGVLLALYAGYRLWLGGLDGRVAAGVLSGVTLLAHVLNLMIGMPGASSLASRITPMGMVSIVLNSLAVALLVADALHRTPAPTPKRPYAL